MKCRAEFEEDDGAIRCHKDVASGRVHRPDGHVPCPGGIANVDWVGEYGACVVALRQLGSQARKAVFAQTGFVDLGDSGAKINPKWHRLYWFSSRPRCDAVPSSTQ